MPPSTLPPLEIYNIYIGFDHIKDGDMRKKFETMATSFFLPPEEVDALKEIGKTLLDESKDFERLTGL